MTAGIVGQGFVGNALRTGLEVRLGVSLPTYDPYKPEMSTEPSLDALVEASDILFVCVPTPMRPSGLCDTSIVESVLAKIDGDADVIVVIKSTIAPGSTEGWKEKYGLRIVHNPEFLTEKNALKDFLRQDRIILGGAPADTAIIKSFYKKGFDVPIVETDATTAELVKYVTNAFLAMKVSFSNEMHQVCSALGIDYATMMGLVCLDKRIDKGHTSVPGPDGSFGFGGHCFPKDLHALIALARSMNVAPTLLDAAWAKNMEVRPEREHDWKDMVGRAVSEVC